MPKSAPKAKAWIAGSVAIAAGLAVWWFASAAGTHNERTTSSLPKLQPGSSKSARLARETPGEYVENDEELLLAERIKVYGPRDYFRVIDQPFFTSAKAAETFMIDGEIVIGVEIGGEARAYSVNYLNDHEMVRDEVAGIPIMVTWCSLCRTGIAYDRRVGGQVFEFRHRGWLLDETFLFFDEGTDSLWKQTTGKCILGPMKGAALERVRAVQWTWGRWKNRYPATKVLLKPYSRIDEYFHDRFAQYYIDKGITFGLALSLENSPRLYPLSELERKPVVEETVAGVPVLIVYHAPSKTVVAWNRRFGDMELSFELVESNERDVIVQDKTMGKWSGISGKPLDPEPTARLEPVTSTMFAEKNWKVHYPNGTVYTTP